MNEVTVESLQKDLRNKYGVTVDISKYSKTQLEDYSAKIKGKLKEFDTKHKFNESLNNETYQKTLLISKIVESAINQYIENPLEDEDDLGEDIVEVDESDEDVARDFAESKTTQDGAGPYYQEQRAKEMAEKEGKDWRRMSYGEKEDYRAKVKKMGESIVKEGAEDDILTQMEIGSPTGKILEKIYNMVAAKMGLGNIGDLDDPEDFDKVHMAVMKKFGIKAEPLASLQKKAQDRLTKSALDDPELTGVKESVVREGAEESAELVMAAKDMVDRFTSFLEDVAEMGAEGMLELQDSIRDEMGQEQADAFVNIVKPALEQTQEVLTSARESLTQGVGVLTGETAPTDTIGAEPEGDIEEPMDTEEPMDMEPATDEFGASEPATGGEEPEGREKRESYQPRKKSVSESTRIMNKLAR